MIRAGGATDLGLVTQTREHLIKNAPHGESSKRRYGRKSYHRRDRFRIADLFADER